MEPLFQTVLLKENLGDIIDLLLKKESESAEVQIFADSKKDSKSSQKLIIIFY